MIRWVLFAVVAAALAVVAWWLLQRSPYVGQWVNVDAPIDTITIVAKGRQFEVSPAGGALVVMQIEGDRLRPVAFGSTLELIYDAQTDRLRYPIYSDTQRMYRRAD